MAGCRPTGISVIVWPDVRSIIVPPTLMDTDVRAPIPVVEGHGINRIKGKGKGKGTFKGKSKANDNPMAKASLRIKPRVKGKPKATTESTLLDVERWLHSRGWYDGN